MFSLYVKAWLKQPQNCSETAERVFDKENSLSEAAGELPAGCVLPQENRLKRMNTAARQSNEQHSTTSRRVVVCF